MNVLTQPFSWHKKELTTLLLFFIFSHAIAEVSTEGPASDFQVWLGSDDAQGQIINGVIPADPSKWRSIYLSQKNGRWCTAFAVGPRTIMTAAHCIPSDKKIMLQRPGKDEVTALCKVPTSYPSDITADYALCGLAADISSGPYETLNQQPDRLKPEMKVLLTGYGCRQFSNQDEQTFSIGTATFRNTAGGNLGVVNGEASVCFGDSGGPAFLASEDDVAQRILIGLNSRMLADGATSLLSLLPTNIESFFQGLNDEGWVICGITPAAKRCRHE